MTSAPHGSPIPPAQFDPHCEDCCDPVTTCRVHLIGPLGDLSHLRPEVREELVAFHAHLQQHREASHPSCCFCAERDAKKPKPEPQPAAPPVGGAGRGAVQVQEQQGLMGSTEKNQRREPVPKEEGPMSDSRITTAYISEVSEPGIATGRVVTLDRTIPIDEAYTDQPQLRWQCEHCEAMERVTAQFKTGVDEDGEDTHITLCAACLQNALNGIAYSLANPVLFDSTTGDV